MELEAYLSESLYEDLSRIRHTVRNYLKSAPDSFIDYSEKHSERIIKILKLLLSTLMQRPKTNNFMDLQPLSEHEIFVLLSAIELHHIGVVKDNKIPLGKFQLENSSHDLILDSVRNPDCTYDFCIPETYAEEISIVVKGLHVSDISSSTYTTFFDEINSKLRLRLLSVLLKLAEGLDITYHSINLQKLIDSNVNINTKVYWGKYFYVQGIGINNGKLEINFRFPNSQYFSYKNSIPKLILQEIEELFLGLIDLLWNYDVFLKLPRDLETHKYLKRSISTLPEDIEQAIENLASGNLIDEGSAKSKFRNVSKFTYDVAISYAGIHRNYAAQLAQKLEDFGLSVFFDRKKIAELSGQILLDKLLSIYRDEANLSVLLVSDPYNKSPYTRHERQAAQDRNLTDTNYIFLVRMDDVDDIQGFHRTAAFVDWDEYGIDGICNLILERIEIREQTSLKQ